MNYFMNKDTGEVFSHDELKTLWKQFGHEMKFDTFEDFVDSLEEAEWYAVQSDSDDNDWGTGSFDYEEAKEMLRQYPEGKIAVIVNGVCVEEISYKEAE